MMVKSGRQGKGKECSINRFIIKVSAVLIMLVAPSQNPQETDNGALPRVTAIAHSTSLFAISLYR